MLISYIIQQNLTHLTKKEEQRLQGWFHSSKVKGQRLLYTWLALGKDDCLVPFRAAIKASESVILAHARKSATSLRDQNHSCWREGRDDCPLCMTIIEYADTQDSIHTLRCLLNWGLTPWESECHPKRCWIQDAVASLRKVAGSSEQAAAILWFSWGTLRYMSPARGCYQTFQTSAEVSPDQCTTVIGPSTSQRPTGSRDGFLVYI